RSLRMPLLSWARPFGRDMSTRVASHIDCETSLRANRQKGTYSEECSFLKLLITPSDRIEDDMPRTYDTLTLEDAKRMLSAAEAKAVSFGIAYNIAVVDAGGHLVAFLRQDGALIGSIDLAIDKAVTARIFDKETSGLAKLAQSGKPLFGIQESNAGQ